MTPYILTIGHFSIELHSGEGEKIRMSCFKLRSTKV